VNHDDDLLNHEDDAVTQHVVITLDLPDGCGTTSLPLAALMDMLDPFERDGIRPPRTTLEVTHNTTP
jgi:hypothetical protein